MADFLLELRSEEIPARMQDKARDDLARLFAAELSKAGLSAADITTFATPRRLALIAKGLPFETQAVSEETKGPKVGAPPQALDGFLRKTGLTQDQLVDRDGVYFAVVEKPGRKTVEVLAEAIPAIIRTFPWPKSQRWGAGSASTESLRWVRPLQGIVALLGDDVVDCEIDGIVSGSATKGHRFHHSGDITIGSAADYAEKLRACHVIVNQEERRNIIRAGAEKAASDAGLVLVPDEGLVNENSGLTEWPVPMLGRFDPAFLAVPEEVIQLTARVNQKYFVCKYPSPLQGRGGSSAAAEGEGDTVRHSDSAGSPPTPTLPPKGERELANAFVCTANIQAHDNGVSIVAGNEKVLAARLSDAKFFWEQDLKVPLAAQAEKLSKIVFHEKLGTVADKVERVAKLARWLVEEGIVSPSPLQGRGGSSAAAEGEGDTVRHSDPAGSPPTPTLPPKGERELLAAQAERAARLCKADLVTGMVGEFPELQGIMGGYYARAQGEPDAVADAVRDHYKPVGQGDDVPTAPVTVAVSLADKLDSLLGFAAIGEMPTGSKDPFALRRAAIGVMRVLIFNNIRLSVETALKAVAIQLAYSRARHMLSFQNEEFRGLADEWLAAQMSDRPMQINENGSVVRMQVGGSMAYYATNLETILIAIIDFHQNAFEQVNKLLALFADRLKVQQREAGVRHDLIDAVFALGGEDDLVRLLARVKALQAFVATQEGADLLAGYKRAANILKSSPSLLGEGDHPQDGGGVASAAGALASTAPPSAADATATSPSKLGEDLSEAELALLNALGQAEPLAASAIAAEDFEGAMAALAGLRAPIDAFFDGVMVNDPDPEKRAFRVGLLTRFRDAVTQVADFSKIEG